MQDKKKTSVDSTIIENAENKRALKIRDKLRGRGGCEDK